MTQPPLTTTRPGTVGDATLAARWRAVLDAAVDAIVIIDTKGCIQEFNRAAREMFGYANDDVVGNNVRMLMAPEVAAQHDGFIGNYLRTGEAKIIGIGRELQAQRRNGETFPIELSVGEIREHGRAGFIGLMRDISRRHAIEATLQARETELRRSFDDVHRLGLLAEISAGIAHELNQPLTAISNYARAAHRLAGHAPLPTALIRDTLNKLAQQAERAASVVQSMRQTLHQPEAPRQHIDCATLLDELCELAVPELRRRGQHLSVARPASLPTLRGHPLQIQQVLLNLVRNAADAQAELPMPPAITLQASARGSDWVAFVIDDAGPGIAPEVAPYVFEPFRSTKTDGFGLGLALSKRIIDNHEGQLSFAASPAGGARFEVLLPCTPEPQ